MLGSDFWWLSSSQKPKYMYVKFGHHRPIKDDEDPCCIKWETKICRTDELNQWCKTFSNTNVYRALRITTAPSDGEELLGPFLVDIDNDTNLNDALDVARKTFGLLRDKFKVDISELKIFFTGHKGFNIEICPEVLGICGCISDQLARSSKILCQITSDLRSTNNLGGKKFGEAENQVSRAGTIIDQIYGRYPRPDLKHPCVRLHGSLNKWCTSDGQAKARMKIELTVNELTRLSIREIISRAEKLAT